MGEALGLGQVVIEADQLTKVYDGKTVVDKLDLKITEGQVFGFLGPNGAGKTTTMLMFLGLTEPTSGKARIAGFDSTRESIKVKRIAGYVPEKVGFYDELSAGYNLSYTARLNGISEAALDKKISDAMEVVGLPGQAGQKVGTFSKGMKQRLAIADVLIKEPKVAFLDEPTSGIDPEGISKMLDLISRVAREGNMTIVLSSHQLNQVERICHRVGIMSKGKLVLEGPIEELGAKALGGKYEIEIRATDVTERVLSGLKSIPGVIEVSRSGDMLLVTCEEDLRPSIARSIIDNQGMLVEIKIRSQGLEDIYLKYFKEA
ncbi:MAG: ABC transporter ATP-binding protein [Chloroflexi bacterium]|nr:ABC transporter ATP-binding protein [Chloroflexota bacterium]